MIVDNIALINNHMGGVVPIDDNLMLETSSTQDSDPPADYVALSSRPSLLRLSSGR